jgi:aminoglycoside phosphotransferase (APT) family kinase protein
LHADMCCSGLMDAADLARRFDLGRAARLSDGPVARGKQGVVWRLDTADGAWAVKIPFHRSSEDEVRMATEFQEAAYAAGVPTPQVRRTAEGSVFALIAGRQVRMYEWVDLKAPDAMLDPARVGAVVAAIHRLSATDRSPLDPWYHEPVGADRWDQLVGLLLEAGAPFASRLAALRDELVALESWIESPELIRTCHRDMWADNVLPTADGGLCVIDWENSGPADPSQELGCVLFEFARTDLGRARGLVGAYRAAGGPAAVTRRGHFSMLIAQLGHITEMAATDWLNPNPRSPERADSAAWISEVLDEPHTRQLLESILGALSGAALAGTRSGRAPVLSISDQIAPFRLRSAEFRRWRLPHGDVGHETVRRRTVPVPLTRRGVDHVPRTDLHNIPAARLDPAFSLGDVQGLSDSVAVPGGARSGAEADRVDTHARGFLTSRDDV